MRFYIEILSLLVGIVHSFVIFFLNSVFGLHWWMVVQIYFPRAWYDGGGGHHYLDLTNRFVDCCCHCRWMIIQVSSTESKATLSSATFEVDQVLFHLLANNWRNFDNISNVLGVTRQTIFQVGRSSEKQFFPTAEKIYNYYRSLCEYHMCGILCCGKWWGGSTSITNNLFTVVLTLLAQYNACYDIKNSFHTHCKNILFEWASCWCFVKFV